MSITNNSHGLSNLTIGDIIPYSARHTPLVWIKSDDKIWFAAAMLSRYLGTFLDCLPIMQDGEFVNIIDGKDILSKVIKTPTYDFFQYEIVERIMNNGAPTILSPKTNLAVLLEDWAKNKRAYSLLKNENGLFSIISARTVSDALPLLNGHTLGMPMANEIISCSRNDTIDKILKFMFVNKIRRIFFEDDLSFVSDRTIIKKIVNDLKFLRETDDFLNLKAGIFESTSPIVLSERTTIQEMCKSMSTAENPCILLNSKKVVTCYDVVMALKNTG